MELQSSIELIQHCKNWRRTAFVCGNGGSATTAEHFTNDLFSKGVRAICLNSNTAIMTMIANDYGYKYVFSKQLEVYAEEGDLLVMFSYSGDSSNILKAKSRGLLMSLKTIEIFGTSKETAQEAESRHLAMAHEISDGIK